jgi:hypothetical protein
MSIQRRVEFPRPVRAVLTIANARDDPKAFEDAEPLAVQRAAVTRQGSNARVTSRA